MDSPPIFPLSDCPRILLALTKDWRAGDNRPETLADVRTALAKLIYALGGQGFPDPASDPVVQQNHEIWKDCLAASRAARDKCERPLPPDGQYAVLGFADATDPTKLASDRLNWPHQARMTFGPIIEADNADDRPKQLFMFEKVDENAEVDQGVRPSPGFWPKPPAPILPIPRWVEILIGFPRGEFKGGMAQFLRYVLQIDSLLKRLIIAAVVCVGLNAAGSLGFAWWGVSLVANLGFVAFGTYLSLLVIRVLAVLVARGRLGRIFTAMWLPILVSTVAAGLLFFNDQGRELEPEELVKSKGMTKAGMDPQTG